MCEVMNVKYHVQTHICGVVTKAVFILISTRKTWSEVVQVITAMLQRSFTHLKVGNINIYVLLQIFFVHSSSSQFQETTSFMCDLCRHTRVPIQVKDLYVYIYMLYMYIFCQPRVFCAMKYVQLCLWLSHNSKLTWILTYVNICTFFMVITAKLKFSRCALYNMQLPLSRWAFRGELWNIGQSEV